MHRVQAWDKKTCSEEPMFESYNVSNQCINLRDGHSVYYDCSNAHLPPLFELNAALRFVSSGKIMWFVYWLIMWLALYS